MSPHQQDLSNSKAGPQVSLSGALNSVLDPVQNPSRHDTVDRPGTSNSSDQANQETHTQTQTPALRSKPSFKRFASAGLNAPFQIAGSIKRGFSTVSTPTTKDRNTSEHASGLNSDQSEINLSDPPFAGQSSTTKDPMSLKDSLKPLENESPIAHLRVRVIRASALSPKDRNGLSDPYISLHLPPSVSKQTPSVKKSLNPSWEGEKERDKSVFDFPLYESLGKRGRLYEGRGLELVVWDRDFGGVRKDYMGEVSVKLGEWGKGGFGWKETMEPSAHMLHSTRRRRRKEVSVSGLVHLQIGLVPPPGEVPVGLTDEWAEDVVRKLGRASAEPHLVDRRLPESSWLTVPAYEGVGTVKIKHKRRRRALAPKNAVRSAAHAVSSSLFHRKDKHSGKNQGDHKEPIVSSGDEEEDDLDEDGSDSYEEPLRDDGLSESGSEPEGDVYSMGFLVPDRARRGTGTSSLSSGTGTERTGGTGDLEPMKGRVIDENAVESFATSPEKESNMKLRVDTSDAPAIVEVPPTASKETAPGYFDKMIPQAEGVSRLSGRQNSKDALLASHQHQSSTGTVQTVSSGLLTPGSVTPGGHAHKKRFAKVRRKDPSGKGYNFGSGKDILGIVMLEISGAKDLPKLRNALKFSFDMDPFVVISFGKKVFRTRVIRHELNPTWDEKLLFHVRRYEDTFNIQFALLDWDKVSGNDYIGSSTIPLEELLKNAPRPDPQTGLYGQREDGKHEMREFSLPLQTNKDSGWESRHSPVLNVRAKYEPYDALRQRFWRQYLLQFDTDNTNSISFTELTTMLDSLNSTLTTSTLESYFTRFGKSSEQDELTYDEIVTCLEDEIVKSESEKKRLRSEPPSGLASPSGYGPMAPMPANDGLDQAGPSARPSSGVNAEELAAHIAASRPGRDDDSEGNGDINVRPARVKRSTGAGTAQHLQVNGALSPISSPELTDSESDMGDRVETERVVNIKSCPLCHRPRLKKKSEADIVTHLAVCASADWDRVDRIVVGNYVTASQAQRKFFTKVLTKVSAGAYSLGANSANIIVQDRLTGQLQEEKMAVYVRLGIRVLYKGAKKGMEGSRARKLLKSMSVKQGLKYNSPESRLEIPTFIAFHKLNTDEILEPLDSFKTFNEFFYRKLKPEARPISNPTDTSTMVSSADCRMMAFETVSEATRLWIKGKEFSVGRLLGDNYKDVWHKYDGGALGIFRLAPQDYHRFHSPVDGIVGKPTRIEGQYYTVNPQAIRTTLDVYGENVREIWPIQTAEYGTVMTVWVGAMMVGSIGSSVKEGDEVKRGDELGWFAFGGSTIVCLFERGTLRWDEDILQNSTQSIETLVRMGMGIGKLSHNST